MTRRLVTILTLVSLLGLPGIARAEADLSGFAGRWNAVAMESSDPEATKAIGLEHLSGRFEVKDGTLRHVGSTLVDTGGASLRFVPSPDDLSFLRSDRPDVLVPMDAKGKLLGGLLADPEDVDPLQGETLRWARVKDGELIYYRFSINPRGGFVLGKYAYKLEGETMAMVFTAFSQNGQPVTVTATLERVGD